MIYKDEMIARIFPSGYYEIYSHVENRFWVFDDLDAAKAKIDEDHRVLEAEKEVSE